jgi:1-aminocyclopropane-1-carboxylate deaminase/D-cysteine desulfhydrase-like pyridoxal-dependent ACC family enzyme
MRLFATFVSVLALTLAGCGQTGSSSSSSKDFKGEQAKVSKAIGDLETAGSGGKAATVCDDIVTTDLKATIASGGSDCAQEMKKAMDDADAFDLNVTAVTITGTKATATVKTPDRGKDVTRTFTLAKQAGGGWRISSFG